MAVLNIQRSLLSITLALSLYNFASGLVGVFVPLIVLKNGAALWEVPLFYVVYALVKLCLNYPAVRLTQRMGAHLGLGLGFVAGALQFLCLWDFTHTHNYVFLWAAAGALGLTNAAIWNSQHIHVSRAMDNATKSSSLATIEVINQVLGVIAPLVGGFVGVEAGSGWLLSIAAVFVALSLIPLQRMGSLGESADTAPVSYRLSHAPKRDVFANFCFNIETAVGVMVWPIYLALEIKTYKSIGAITALSALLAVIVVSIAGHRGDRGHDRRVLTEGVAASSVIDFVRLIPFNSLGITLVSMGYRSSLAYMQNPWTSTYYNHTKRLGIPYVMSMEIACDLAYAALWIVLLAVALLWTAHAMFDTAFVIAAVAAWGCLLITRQVRSDKS